MSSPSSLHLTMTSEKKLPSFFASLPPPSTGPTTLPPILPPSEKNKQPNNKLPLLYLPSIFNDHERRTSLPPSSSSSSSPTFSTTAKRKLSSSSAPIYPTSTLPFHNPMHTVYRRDSSASASDSDSEPSAVFSKNSFSDLSNSHSAPHYRITTNTTTTTTTTTTNDLSRPLTPNVSPSSPIQIHTRDSTLLLSQIPPSNRRGVPRSGLRHSCKYPECGWSFKRFEHLKRHLMTHSGEKPFLCEFPGCGKSFGRSDNFAAHARTHNLHPTPANGEKHGVDSAPASAQEKKRPRLNSSVTLPVKAETQGPSKSPSPAAPQSPSKSCSIKMLLNEDVSASRAPDNLPVDPTDDERNAAALCLASLPFAAQRDLIGLTLTTSNPPLSPTSSTTLTSPSSPTGSPTNYTGTYNTFLDRSAPVQQRRSLPVDFYPSRNESGGSTSTLLYNESIQAHSRPSLPTGTRSQRAANSSDAFDPSKPHVCTHPSGCNRRFKRREHLRRHSRTHTDEKPFVCPTCHKSFSRSDNLNQHARTHGVRTSLVTTSPKTLLQRSASMTSFTSSPSAVTPVGISTESSQAEHAS